MHLPKSFLLWLCISFCSTLPAFSSIVASSITKERGIVVGFLQTEKETYPEELTFSYNITEMLTGLGAHVTRIDYNTIVDFENIRLELLKELGGDISKLRTMEAERIKQEVLSFIKKGGISRIFIPGNYYNVDTEPYPPTHHRQSITKAIAEITREDPSIRIMGVCGGLQGVMHALGIKVTRVGNLVSSAESATAHAVSMPDPHGKDVHLHRMRVVPNSRLAGIVSKHVSADVNGWISLFFPDAHGGVVSNDPENMKKLESMGYRVVGFSDDGVIEAVEDMHGNILFQDHPEALAINILKGNVFHFSEGGSSTQEDVTTHTEERYKAALSAVAIIEDFLYR